METNLEKIKEIARLFLYTDIKDLGNGFVSHPFAQFAIQGIKVDNNFVMVNLQNDNELVQWQKYILRNLNTIQNVQRFLMLITKPYLSAFFKHIQEYLSDEDYASMLYEVWISVEYPNFDVNVSKSEFLKMFKRANKSFLMNQEEQSVLEDLPETITVYRGLQRNASTEALSWTLDKNVAEWFANRFDNNGEVIKATINKKYIFAYINGRGEKEVVLDYKKLVF